ncbi:MAG: hypothetical protein V4662_27565 [Verrucomicrobiota bacterium]
MGLLSITACMSPRKMKLEDTAKLQPQRWQVGHVEGLQVNLMDPIRLQWMSFSRMNSASEGVGYVSITYGTKDCFTFPARRWKIDDGKLVVFAEGASHEIERLELLSLTRSLLIARRSTGQIVQYEVQHHQKLAPGVISKTSIMKAS